MGQGPYGLKVLPAWLITENVCQPLIIRSNQNSFLAWRTKPLWSCISLPLHLLYSFSLIITLSTNHFELLGLLRLWHAFSISKYFSLLFLLHEIIPFHPEYTQQIPICLPMFGFKHPFSASLVSFALFPPYPPSLRQSAFCKMDIVSCSSLYL